MNDLFAVHYSWLFPLCPLIGAILSGFLGAKWLKSQSHWPIWIGVGISAALSLCLLFHTIQLSNTTPDTISTTITWYHWIDIGHFSAAAGAFIDPLTAVMLTVVCCIGFLITIFSKGYMAGEEGYFRFFAYLGLFIFSMTLLVMGNNFILLYLGWEGVGVCSYLLIGYYYERPAAREAAKKAFLVNRVGDFGFGIGIMLIYLTFGTVSFFGAGAGTHTGVLELATSSTLNDFQQHALAWIPFLLMIGAFGKSAQFPLYVWLPDAMEGPTPVSALIHAATMVTAGIYMIARCSTLFVQSEAALLTIAAVGCFTALFAATIALRQFDLKKVFAYSTISQLGFMFAGVGLLAPVAGVFHLVTHAFFKALLFLSSGVVMHAMAGELDMRKMSGLKHVLPKTRWLMLVGCLALAGCPFFSGFFSKDEIVGAALSHPSLLGRIIGAVLLFSAFLTAYYTFRLYFRVFEGPLVTPHAAHHNDHDHSHAHNHEPLIMILPLFILMLGALLAGYLNFPKNYLGDFLGHSPSFQLGYQTARSATGIDVPAHAFGQPGEEHLDMTTMVISGAISILGILLASYYHLKNRPASDALVQKFAPIARLLEGKFWVDEVYERIIVDPLYAIGRAFTFIDRIVVDGLVAIISFIPQLFGWSLKLTIQRGYLQGYGAAMLFGVAIILLVIFL
ncbi:MAG TPA: NADH-quinone oxidoreductase subunit L [Tepidisphaeraceae bacterium]|jgi:NADH-quinone oxidoreductase subunit L|nr:NADH-quinone oxidoreductase subunit L [Tepidisphaeraceae bacterium]